MAKNKQNWLIDGVLFIRFFSDFFPGFHRPGLASMAWDWDWFDHPLPPADPLEMGHHSYKTFFQADLQTEPAVLPDRLEFVVELSFDRHLRIGDLDLVQY